MHVSELCIHRAFAKILWTPPKINGGSKKRACSVNMWVAQEKGTREAQFLLSLVIIGVLRILTGFFAEIVWNELYLNRCSSNNNYNYNTNNANMTHACSLASAMPPLPCGLMKMQWTKPDFSFPFNVQIYTIVASIHISKVVVNKIRNSRNNKSTEMATERMREKNGKHFDQKIEQSFMFPYSKCCRMPFHYIQSSFFPVFFEHRSWVWFCCCCCLFFTLCSLFRCFCSCCEFFSLLLLLLSTQSSG